MRRSLTLFFFLAIPILANGQLKNDYEEHIKKLYPTIASNYRVTHKHTSRLSKIHHTYLVQTIQNLDLTNVVLSIHTDEKGNLVKVNNGLFPGLNAEVHNTLPSIDEIEAIKKLATHLGLTFNAPKDVLKDPESNITKVYMPSFARDTMICRLAFFLEKKTVKLVWQINAQILDDWWDAKIDAVTGMVLDKVNWVSHCNFEHTNAEHMHSSACMVPNSFNVFPSPLESPIHGPRSLMINPANTLASPYGWNDTNGVPGPEFTTSKGNNVEAKDDIANDNETTAGAFAQGGANLEFDFPFTTNVAVTNNLNASLANLFYWNNVMHDVWYQYGFDEASGNFQSNNYGRGGIGNDFVFADGLDGSGTNNANFSTPVDGSRPRMQMYKWNVSKAEITSPAAVAGTISAAKANFGAAFYNITNQVVIADPLQGCTAFNNAAAIAGKIALVDRGTCEFGLKCLNAQNAGAIAVIVCNNVSGAPTAMTPGANGASVTIPSVMVSQSDCNTIKLNINNPSVFVKLVGGEYDSGFDNLVIAHEYGHGISTRLTGGAANSSCLSGEEQMGEGWSDWFGLMLSMKSYHTGAMGRGVGNYLTTQDTNGVGIRQYRYSTNMVTNPHTYNSIYTTVAPHGVGSVWCAMLWELTWAMIDEYGFDPDLYNGTGGNNMAMQLVIEGIKLQPCFPGFVDGRDAILIADKVLYGGANQCLIWKAFAKRGLGFSASQGASRSKTDGVQAFDLPPTCTDVNLSIATTNKYASPGDTLLYTIKTKNIGTSTLTNIVLKDTLADNLQFVSATNGSASGAVITYAPFNLTVGDSMTNSYKAIVLPNAKINLDSIIENAESILSKFAASNTNKLQQHWTKSSTAVKSGTFSWFARNDTTNNEKYFTLKVPIKPADLAYMQFWHKYNTETNWDGGRVQVSTDNKLTWKDLGSKMILNGYNAYVDNNVSYPAFSGNSNTFVNTVIDLTAYKGQNIYVRFWMHNDGFDAVEGWYIDDIIFHNSKATVSAQVYQTNTQSKNVNEQTYPPVNLVPCYQVYSKDDSGQGSLRRALACSTNGSQISMVEGMENDTIAITSSTLVIDKNVILANLDSTTMHILATNPGSTFELTNNAVVTLLGLDINKNNATGHPAIIKSNGVLTIDESKIKVKNNDDAIRNLSGEVVMRRSVVLDKN